MIFLIFLKIENLRSLELFLSIISLYEKQCFAADTKPFLVTARDTIFLVQHNDLVFPSDKRYVNASHLSFIKQRFWHSSSLIFIYGDWSLRYSPSYSTSYSTHNRVLGAFNPRLTPTMKAMKIRINNTTPAWML